MVTSVPYLASSAWYSAWLKGLADGFDDTAAADYANAATSSSGKDFARCLIPGNCGPMMLSVAVKGGASRLKHDRGAAVAELSTHGNWPRVHLGALEAVYGRAPYFEHYMPVIRGAIDSGAATLRELCSNVHEAVAGMIAGDLQLIPPLSRELPPHLRERADELKMTVDPRLSVIDPLMRLGPDTLLALL